MVGILGRHQAGCRHRPRIDHRRIRLVVMHFQRHHRIERLTCGIGAHLPVELPRTYLLHRERGREDLRDRLQRELIVDVASRKRLTVNGRHANPEQLLVHHRESWYVVGVLAAPVFLVLGVCGVDRLRDSVGAGHGSQFCPTVACSFAAVVTTRWMKPSFATTCGWIVNGYRSSRPIELLTRLSTPDSTNQSAIMSSMVASA